MEPLRFVPFRLDLPQGHPPSRGNHRDRALCPWQPGDSWALAPERKAAEGEGNEDGVADTPKGQASQENGQELPNLNLETPLDRDQGLLQHSRGGGG